MGESLRLASLLGFPFHSQLQALRSRTKRVPCAPQSHGPEQLQGCEPQEGLNRVADVRNSITRIFVVHGVQYHSRKANEFTVYNCIPGIVLGPGWHTRCHQPYLVTWSSLQETQVPEVQTQEGSDLVWQMEDDKVIRIITESH